MKGLPAQSVRDLRDKFSFVKEALENDPPRESVEKEKKECLFFVDEINAALLQYL